MARVLVQIPDPRRHLVRYYGAYSNRARGQRRKAEAQLGAHGSSETSQEPVPTPPQRAALRRRKGESDPASVRSRAAGVSSLWSRDASRQLHHRPARGQAHRGPSPQARQARAPPSSPRPPAGGQPGLRFAPSRPRTSGMGQGGVVGPGPHRWLSRRPAVSLERSQGREHPPKAGDGLSVPSSGRTGAGLAD